MATLMNKLQLQCHSSLHSDQLLNAMERLKSGEKDLFIVTEDGERIETQRSLVCMYSSSMASYLKDVPCCGSTSISLPFSSLTLNNLLKVLVDGVLMTDALEDLTNIKEAAKILGIDLQNIYFGPGNDECDLDEAYNTLNTALDEACNTLNTVVKTEPGVSNAGVTMKRKAEKRKIKWKKMMKTKQEARKIKEELITEGDEMEKSFQEAFPLDKRGRSISGEDEVKRKSSVKSNLKSRHRSMPPTESNHIKNLSTAEQGGKGKYECKNCDVTAKSKGELLKHVKSTHYNEPKPYTCSVCQKSFKTKKYVETHEKNHGSEEKKSFPCNLCNKSFKTEWYVKTHAKSHSVA